MDNDISKTLVAFANSDGGELFVGIEDDSTISGLPYKEELISAILNAPENYVMRETPLTNEISSLNKPSMT